MTATKQRLRTHVRWCIRRDCPEVLRIDTDSFPDPWSEDDFLRHLRRRNCIAMVAEYGDRVVGFMVYELEADHLTVARLAVAPECRGRGVGRQLVDKLVGKLSSHRRTRLELVARESNLGGHLFLRACGFRAETVEPDWYEDTGEDGYAFAFRLA